MPGTCLKKKPSPISSSPDSTLPKVVALSTSNTCSRSSGLRGRNARCRDFREPDQWTWLADNAIRTFVNTYGRTFVKRRPNHCAGCKVSFSKPPFRAMCNN